MQRKIVSWLFPLVMVLIVALGLGWLWMQRQTTRRVPTTVDPEFIRPMEDIQTEQEVLQFPPLSFSDEFQDPFISDVPCFVYADNACMPWMQLVPDETSSRLVLYGIRSDAYTLRRWSYVFGRQFMPDFPLFAYYLQEKNNDITAYNDYRSYVANINSKVSGTKINPVFLFAYTNYLLELDPQNITYQREVISKSLLFMRYFQAQQDVLRNASFANEGMSSLGKVFIAVTSAVYGDEVARKAFSAGGALESYYLREFSTPLHSQGGLDVQVAGTVAGPRALYQQAQEAEGQFVTLCDGQGALACELKPASVECYRIEWLDNLCGINIYQEP